MITYLPKIYPDELVYSWFCRYAVHSGYTSHKQALENVAASFLICITGLFLPQPSSESLPDK